MINFLYLPTAPKIFPVAYNIVKHFIDENTRRKVIVAGGTNCSSKMLLYL